MYEIEYSQFLHDQASIRDVTIRGNALTGPLADNRSFMTRRPADPALATRLADANIAVTIAPADDPSSTPVTLLVSALSLAISLFRLVPLFRIAEALGRNVGRPGQMAEPRH